MEFIQNVGALLVLIGIMILIHELGHYWAAIYFGVRVEAFSFGFGPRIFGFKKGDTDFRFSLIPFGGYVKMTGQSDTGEAYEASADEGSFMNKPRWQRLIIAFAGPAMNIILAVGLVTGVFMVRFPKMLNVDGPAVIGHIAPGSPAAQAGLQEGDRIVRLEDSANPTWEDVALREAGSVDIPLAVIVERKTDKGPTTDRYVLTPKLDSKTGLGYLGWSEQNETLVAAVSPGMGAEKAGLQKGDVIIAVNGVPLHSTMKLHELVRASAGKPLDVAYARSGERAKVAVTPTFSKDDTPEGRWMIGVRLEPRYVITQLSFPDALSESVKQNTRSAGLIFGFVRGIVEQRMSPKSLEGPIRIGQLSGEAAREGIIPYVSLMAMVSLNLAIFNLLPIPILDGGMILMLLIEMLMQRDLSLRVKETVLKFGFVFLMALVVFVLYNDITKTIGG
ncbi:MAG: RIP metalloprotease RseP [Acidobacteria bacterium]|nr:RIP metalloprotease RseP [Acidobacteriota bacterium]